MLLKNLETFTDAPRVKVTNSTILVIVGQTITLNCSADASPPITVLFWAKSGRPIDINNPSKYSGGTIPEPTLRIFNAASSDTASDYVCVASNLLLSTFSIPVNVFVICKLLIPLLFADYSILTLNYF